MVSKWGFSREWAPPESSESSLSNCTWLLTNDTCKMFDISDDDTEIRRKKAHPKVVKSFLSNVEKQLKELSKKLNGLQKATSLLEADVDREDLNFERDRLCIDLGSSMTDTVTMFLRFLGKYNGIGFENP